MSSNRRPNFIRQELFAESIIKVWHRHASRLTSSKSTIAPGEMRSLRMVKTSLAPIHILIIVQSLIDVYWIACFTVTRFTILISVWGHKVLFFRNNWLEEVLSTQAHPHKDPCPNAHICGSKHNLTFWGGKFGNICIRDNTLVLVIVGPPTKSPKLHMEGYSLSHFLVTKFGNSLSAIRCGILDSGAKLWIMGTLSLVSTGGL